MCVCVCERVCVCVFVYVSECVFVYESFHVKPNSFLPSCHRFYETFYRHSTNKYTYTVNFLSSQSIIVVVKKISKFIQKSAQRHVLTGITQILVFVETPFWSLKLIKWAFKYIYNVKRLN